MEALAREGAVVTGVDPSEKSLAVARAHAAQSGLAIDYRRASGEALGASGLAQGFDLVFAVDVLEHVDDLDATLAAIAGVLAPGGGLGFLTHSRSVAAFLQLIWKKNTSNTPCPKAHDFALNTPASSPSAWRPTAWFVQEMKGLGRAADGSRSLIDDTR